MALERALVTLNRGGLIVIPTDTVYGVGGNAYDAATIEKLFALKRRDPDKPIPVLIEGIDSLPRLAHNPPDAALTLARLYWPGPLTLVVERCSDLPDVLARGGTVGVRAPDHPFTSTLLAHAGPLAVTSANFSGKPSVRRVKELDDDFLSQVDLIVDAGLTPGGIASTVVDCTKEPIQLLREGPLRFQDVLRSLEQGNSHSH